MERFYAMDLVDIKDRLWNGSINIKILININGKNSQYLSRVYRNSYFPIIFEDIILYYSLDLPILQKVPIWLEYEQVPIKWNLPVGVLYDYLYKPGIQPESTNTWCLNLRYKGDTFENNDYPWEYIVPFQVKVNNCIDYSRSLNQIVMSQLKQAVFILNGNSKPVMNLSKSDSNDLFESIRIHNLYDYNRINKKILGQITQYQKLPIKFYIPGTNQIQSPLALQKISLTLQDLLLKQFPNLFPDVHNSFAIPYIQGVDSTSLMLVDLTQIWQTFKLVDNFLHIVLILK